MLTAIPPMRRAAAAARRRISSEEVDESVREEPEDRRSRKFTTPDQRRVLQGMFVENRRPHPDVLMDVSKQLGMSYRAVRIWFQNKRARSPLDAPERPDLPRSVSAPGGISTGSAVAGKIVSRIEPEVPVAKIAAVRITPIKVASPLQSCCVVHDSFAMKILEIGSWTLASEDSLDVIVTGSEVIFNLEAEAQRYQLRYAFESISSFSVASVDAVRTNLKLTLRQPPQTFVLRHVWMECIDFTMNGQATKSNQHKITQLNMANDYVIKLLEDASIFCETELPYDPIHGNVVDLMTQDDVDGAITPGDFFSPAKSQFDGDVSTVFERFRIPERRRSSPPPFPCLSQSSTTTESDVDDDDDSDTLPMEIYRRDWEEISKVALVSPYARLAFGRE